MTGQPVQEMTFEEALLEMAQDICVRDGHAGDAHEVTLDAPLDELGMDSLDKIGVLEYVEEQFGNLSFDSAKIGQFQTLQEAADFLKGKYQPQELDRATSFYLEHRPTRN